MLVQNTEMMTPTAAPYQDGSSSRFFREGDSQNWATEKQDGAPANDRQRSVEIFISVAELTMVYGIDIAN
jgi:hypothetical protein